MKTTMSMSIHWAVVKNNKIKSLHTSYGHARRTLSGHGGLIWRTPRMAGFRSDRYALAIGDECVIRGGIVFPKVKP